jgi:hypothetical protein
VTTFPESALKVDRRTYDRHDFYNLIMRPDGVDFILQLKLAEHGRSLGVLQVPRQNGDPEFTDRDRTLLEWIAPSPPMLWRQAGRANRWLRATTAA